MAGIEHWSRLVMSQSIYLIKDSVMSVKAEFLGNKSEDQPPQPPEGRQSRSNCHKKRLKTPRNVFDLFGYFWFVKILQIFWSFYNFWIYIRFLNFFDYLRHYLMFFIFFCFSMFGKNFEIFQSFCFILKLMNCCLKFLKNFLRIKNVSRFFQIVENFWNSSDFLEFFRFLILNYFWFFVWNLYFI